MHIQTTLCIALALTTIGHAQTTVRASVDSTGGQANGSSLFPASISADGSVVAFTSWATNLIPNDTNGMITDIFVHDLETGQTSCVSVNSAGIQGDSYCAGPSVSADGRFVAFSSVSTNLVPNDRNNVSDVFVHDRVTGSTTLVSVDSTGLQADKASVYPSISADGQVVAFTSMATNLVGDDTNDSRDAFVHDRKTGVTRRVSVASSGREGNDASYRAFLSADGKVVAFYSYATNLVPGDTNGFHDIFVHELATGQTSRVSLHSDGSQANERSWSANLSADGRLIAFTSFASNLVDGDSNGVTDIFVHDRLSGATTRVSVDSNGIQGNSHSEEPFISGDGQRVAFSSIATNFVAQDSNPLPDIYVHDLRDGTTTLASAHSDGTQSNSLSAESSLSWDGERVAFMSWAENLVDGDTNGEHDIFVRDCSRPVGTSYCVSTPNSAGAGALLSATGSASIAANELTLRITGSPPLMLGFFFYGPGQGQVPFGDGFLCVSAPFSVVSPALHAGTMGTAQRWLDNRDPAHAPSFTPGATLYFQWWYRDPAANMTGFNLSDGLEVTLAP